MAARQQKENYQRVLDQTIEQLTKEGKVPTLLLHSCCAPCSSYVLEYLSKYFKITLLSVSYTHLTLPTNRLV